MTAVFGVTLRCACPSHLHVYTEHLACALVNRGVVMTLNLVPYAKGGTL